MSVLFKYNYAFRHNFFLLVGVCLCVYFSYHLVFGQRSIIALVSLDNKIETLSQKENVFRQARASLEADVVRMRTQTIDRDLLVQKVHSVLGYYHEDDLIVFE